jgi:Transposase DDE domain
MFYPHSRAFRQFKSITNSFIQGDGLPLRDVLAEDLIERIAAEEDVGFGSTFTTALVLWAFVTQAISKDQTCLAAVARIITVLVGSGQEACSSHTGGYCKARQKLSEKFLRRLTVEVGQGVEDQAPDAWRWHGRRALLVDGSTTTGPDTAANQAVYPQPQSQKPGWGFPSIRFVVLLALATAALVDAAVGPYSGKESGETALLRTLFASLRDDYVLVADRYYCSYWMLAMLQERGVDCVFRMHQLRHYDFRRGRRLGPDDQIVTWTKPQRPAWMDEATYAALPDSLTLRQMRTGVSKPGFRVKELVVVTTLTDAKNYPSAEVLDLYHERWHVELDLRSIKMSLQMDELRCQTPDMLRKELWAHLLAYNLIRKVMAQAAMTADIQPRQISFMATVQTLNEFRHDLLDATPEQLRRLAAVIFQTIVAHRVGDRPDRCEPRAIKRRPKPHDLLMVPRAEARAKLLCRRKSPNQ